MKTRSFLRRLARLEGGRCPNCKDWPEAATVYVYQPDRDVSAEIPPPKTCPVCGWEQRRVVRIWIGCDPDCV